jgi:two-component system CheB/CheR fusion protein
VNPDGQDEQGNAGLEDLLIFVRDARGFDFTGYKRSSLGRRIRKRMGDVAVSSFTDYRDLLETDADEFRALFNTILINVTSFFRDTDCWTFLQREVLPDLLAARAPDEEIRVWSAGCSSGEEPYSLAILFAEVLGVEECARRVKIYGTDVDEEALRQARAGVYPARSLEPLSAELRDRYFEPATTGHYAFRNDLRRRVIFGRHDITRDAPISRLDLLVCRNTLMYFNIESQKQIIDRFHFALRDGGTLFLGKAEMLLSDNVRFEVINMRQRIFRRRPGGAGTQHSPVLPQLQAATGHELRDASRRRQLRDLTLEAAPNAIILIDAGGSIAMFNDQARDMFGLAPPDLDRPFRDFEFSYRPVELRSLLERAEKERHHVRVTGAERRTVSGETQYLDVLVQPLFGNEPRPVGMALTFLDTTQATRLENEVQHVRHDLERAYEALQSTNEELETTNEELESGNEELETMNEELRIRSGELDEARGFLAGVLSSIVAGVVVLDPELRIRSWNRGAEDRWGLRGLEVADRYFFDLDFGLAVADVRAMVNECRETRHRTGPIELAAVNRIGRNIVCSVACSPLDDRGVVLLMEEIRKD